MKFPQWGPRGRPSSKKVKNKGGENDGEGCSGIHVKLERRDKSFSLTRGGSLMHVINSKRRALKEDGGKGGGK